MDALERELHIFELMDRDSDFERLIDDARTLNLILADTSLSDDEVKNYVRDLNDRWFAQGYNGKDLAVTGDVLMTGNAVTDSEIKSHEDFSILQFPGKQPFDASRFVVVDDMQVSDDSLQVERQVYLAATTLVEVSEGGVDDMDHVHCLIPLRQEVAIVHEGLTPKRAALWLEYYGSDVKADIDNIVMQARHEGDATVDLADVLVDLRGYSPELREEYCQNLSLYTDTLLEYDLNVPYLAALDGIVRQYDPDGQERGLATIRTSNLVTLLVNRLSFEVDRETFIASPWLEAALLVRPRGRMTNLRIPLSSIQELESTSFELGIRKRAS